MFATVAIFAIGGHLSIAIQLVFIAIFKVLQVITVTLVLLIIILIIYNT